MGAVTIAACFVTPEGVVFGADSTASAMLKGGFHYFNHNQKVFEIGEPGMGTLGLATWGLGALGTLSHRTLVARFYDGLAAAPATDVKEVADRWTEHIWPEYSPLLAYCRSLNSKKAFDAAANQPDPAARTKDEEEEFEQLKRGLVLGFFIGGYLGPNRIPEAFAINFDQLAMPNLPIREAIDFVHACIASTIKAMKFSSLAQICGGPIEIAVITSDRRFRWVRHKKWAIMHLTIPNFGLCFAHDQQPETAPQR